jgi:hypothetical protein
MEGTPLSNARQWLADNLTESVTVASRIFHVLRSTLQSSMQQLQQP